MRPESGYNHRTLYTSAPPKYSGQWAVTRSWIWGGLFLHLQPVHLYSETAASTQSLSKKEAAFTHNLIRDSHGGVTVDTLLLGCYAVSVGEQYAVMGCSITARKHISKNVQHTPSFPFCIPSV